MKKEYVYFVSYITLSNTGTGFNNCSITQKEKIKSYHDLEVIGDIIKEKFELKEIRK